MQEQTIQSQDIKIAEVFHDFYCVPAYQREYVWERDQVDQLLSDVHAELSGHDPARAPEYFIGSIVVCPGKDGVLELIDGQQRMTTLFLIFFAIRDRFEQLGEQPPGALAPQIAATSTDVAGRDQFRYRIDLQYEDSEDILIRIAEGKFDEAACGNTRSIINIRNAYHAALDFLEREFADDAAALRAFYGYLTNKVKIIRIHTNDIAKALKIFETINDRGVGLDSMDLLKNLLFMQADRGKFDSLKALWKELQDVIFEIGERPLRFLRYFILSQYDVDDVRSLTEDKVYAWFVRNENSCGYSTDPLRFANELLTVAKSYHKFLEGCDPNGCKRPHVENLRMLGGRAARYHLILLLAGRHLEGMFFDRLAREIEELLFMYLITREPTREFERKFARWAREVRGITNGGELESVIASYFVPAKRERARHFRSALLELYSYMIPRYRLRYVLAKLAQYVDIMAYGETEGTKWLARYTSGDFEVEHIFPQQPSKEAVEEFGPSEDPRIGDRLGNLVLVEKSVNAALGNRPYSRKKDVYRQSQLLLTRALAERPRVGTNTRIDAAVGELDPFSIWNEDAVIARQRQLAVLAASVWRLPSSSGGRETGAE